MVLNKCKTMKRLYDNKGESLSDLECGYIFLDKASKASSKKKTDKLDFIKISNFCSVKDNVK